MTQHGTQQPPSTESTAPAPAAIERHRADGLLAFCEAALGAAGADADTAAAASRAMLHGSRFGVDSHGVRLLDHYVTVIAGGRVKGAPDLRFHQGAAAVATLDADHGHGARAAYAAMDLAMEKASLYGIGAVAIRNSSHFGAAGAYALEAAENGFIGLAFCNSDSFVRLHGGAERFHGTNPIAMGVPVRDEDPWLLDMATSAIPYNRVLLYRSLGQALPPEVASDAVGHDTTDPHAVDMLAPLGAAFGFKGAALAGVVEVFSAVLAGARLSFDIAPMGGPDFATPRNVGAFVMALKPGAFVTEMEFDVAMKRYRDTLRASCPAPGDMVMAPGDREWTVAAQRQMEGIPIDPATAEAFDRIATRFALPRPRPVS
ncbi:Ldh family oxidoreductase [Xanthobacter dioxanivorans]|uniref:Ldh family oxidoreductase n=1 Tax=Xanthobacter dioxanivorans TaxID=2528964 RepID=A0A974PMN5_9HYPH|nr:Ldh family oxidoreductase [Xanthobacter dioxanivorans]QRG06374.1 Ldh family oxidoreductase [Xanthobacter dioxanivorans]